MIWLSTNSSVCSNDSQADSQTDRLTDRQTLKETSTAHSVSALWHICPSAASVEFPFSFKMAAPIDNVSQLLHIF